MTWIIVGLIALLWFAGALAVWKICSMGAD